ncbi:hypothetical protein [Pontibacter harenae]|uniref:hypothetical protein n=1 Tax=Pontibacter harenae TaxID=2894083 RepID=UPI001E4A4E5F|nr:hypothetical protein [Pontibacter harenae]MCC9167925.1 hypothetical protein [Pontibacter harenae]
MPKYSREEFPANSIVYERTCPYCARDFWANKPRAVYCSAKCRVYANKRKREAQAAGTAEHKPLNPVDERGNPGPALVGEGSRMRLDYHNPFDEEIRKIDPHADFELKHEAGIVVQSEESLASYYTLRLKGCMYYNKAVRYLLLEDQINNFRQLTPPQKRFLASEEFRVDAEISRLNRLLRQITR